MITQSGAMDVLELLKKNTALMMTIILGWNHVAIGMDQSAFQIQKEVGSTALSRYSFLIYVKSPPILQWNLWIV